ncbi:MAG TPA: nuclear transport factor 2 family protein [Planctomycetota bacterium]|nr:nuclear transport factor 2 family protein [Planctomycetota bacterium]
MIGAPREPVNLTADGARVTMRGDSRRLGVESGGSPGAALRATALSFAALVCGCSAPRAPAPAAAGDPAAVLDALHAAASRADGAAYFALFLPDAVFIGTDASERWDLPAFRAYAEPYFARGQGWTYVPTERQLVLGPSGDVAWFDERLQNEKYGETRGSGVLVRRDGRWLVAQYVLSFPVPNELAPDLVERVRALPARR